MLCGIILVKYVVFIQILINNDVILKVDKTALHNILCVEYFFVFSMQFCVFHANTNFMQTNTEKSLETGIKIHKKHSNIGMHYHLIVNRKNLYIMVDIEGQQKKHCTFNH